MFVIATWPPAFDLFILQDKSIEHRPFSRPRSRSRSHSRSRFTFDIFLFHSIVPYFKITVVFYTNSCIYVRYIAPKYWLFYNENFIQLSMFDDQVSASFRFHFKLVSLLFALSVLSTNIIFLYSNCLDFV